MAEARPHMEHGAGLLNPSPATPDPATAGPAEELTVHFSRATKRVKTLKKLLQKSLLPILKSRG